MKSSCALRWMAISLAIPVSVCANLTAGDALAEGFARPPEETKPWCYWYWISDHISKEGITKDLEAMARVGIGEALIGNIFLDDVSAGTIKVLSPQWWELVEHAVREGGRLGVNIGMFNCPGWSQSGGPWIKPEQAMRYLAVSETRVSGPGRFFRKLPAVGGQFQDVAILAFQAPVHDSEFLSGKSVRVNCTPAVTGADRLVDGNVETTVELPEGAGRGTSPFTVELAVNEPFTARSIEILPGSEAFGADCELQMDDGSGGFRTVRQFKCDRSNMSINVGFMPRGPVAISFPAVTATRFNVVFKGVFGNSRKAQLAEIRLAAAARLEAYVEKQLGKMHPTPLPMWETYMWPTQPEPDNPGLVVSQTGVRDLTKQLAPDGTLVWEIPPGDWIIQRIGMMPTGVRNSPASPEGQGLEVDKMNRDHARHHFEAFMGEILRRIPPEGRKALKHVVADSYEMGSQNWTDGFASQFVREYGYDPVPWLPVLSGRLVGSADRSERFLWDLRRLIADRIATEYVGGLRDASQRHGLELWLENYGHWGFPSEFLKYGGESDRVSGEYWVTGDLGSIELRAASSCANTYGKRFVSAEAFTGGPPFQNAPAALKARGDWSFCEGVNHFVLHVNIHQPWEDRIPGVNAWFGTEFNRHNTWFGHGKPWVDYLRRCCWMLQQGNRVADVAYVIGEDAPKMTGIRKPVLPDGHDFDYINAEVIQTRLTFKDGLLMLPHGTTYRVLVLPEQSAMRPALLRRIRDLVKAGATIVGPPPCRSPSMQDYPRCDSEVQELAREIWGETAVQSATGTAASASKSGEHALGNGRVFWGGSLDHVFESIGLRPDFRSSIKLRFTHRRSGNTDVYFAANPRAEACVATVSFRAGNKAPELWWPDSGQTERPAVYEAEGGMVRMPLALGPCGSVLVVFRQDAAPSSQRIVAVRRQGREVLSTTIKPTMAEDVNDASNSFTFALWVKPIAETAILPEANRGVVGMGDKRNEVWPAPHGDTFGGGGRAGAGLAVGTNGVCVFEHGANYFAPTLVHPAAILDWTHLVVVYGNGQPVLYLNGARVHTGLRSEHIVHCGSSAGPTAQFHGRAGTVECRTRALNDAEVAALAAEMPRPDASSADIAVKIVRSSDRHLLVSASPGKYELAFGDGNRREIVVPDQPPAADIAGPWGVSFDSRWGGIERMTFQQLQDWSTRGEEGVKHYSGKATYRKVFHVPGELTAKTGQRVYLDLGEVRDLAAVRINGREVGVLWIAPWRIDVTGMLRSGQNEIEVDVVNVWNNRLIGDLSLPKEQRRTFLLAPTVNKNSPLLPAGLMGPVRVQPTPLLEVSLQ